MNINFNLRMAQLDLARQMETIDFIKSYIKILSESNFTTLFIYVEWRIRTKTFDIGENYGYDTKEIKEIIEYGKEYNIDVIPGLASLGHAELLLEREEFKDYAELRDGNVGRWQNSNKHDLCPSKTEVKEFLSNYFQDISEIFESEYIHIGGDEVWDFNYCSDCRAKAPDFKSEQNLYLEHIKFCRQIVVENLGKKMMLWDDMFEIYQDILPQLPKDIILVNWQYQTNVRGYMGHFKNCIFYNQYKLYNDLSIPYIVAPADYSFSNIITTTKLSNSYNPQGALITFWEKTNAFMHKYIPLIITTGFIWSNKAPNGNVACKMMCEKLFGIRDNDFSDAIESYLQDISRQYYSNYNAICTYSFYGPNNLSMALTNVMYNTLSNYKTKCIDDFAAIILETILKDIKETLFNKRCKLHTYERLNYLETTNSFPSLIEELSEITENRLDLWNKLRPNIDNSNIKEIANSWQNDLQKFDDNIKNKAILRILFVLPDSYGAEFFKVTIIDDDNNENIIAEKMVIKEGLETIFERCFFIDKDFKLAKVRIESNGYGGQGVAYVSSELPDGIYIPQGVSSASGNVTNVQAVLNNDITHAYFGNTNIGTAFKHKEQSTMINTLEIIMQKK